MIQTIVNLRHQRFHTNFAPKFIFKFKKIQLKKKLRK